MHRSVADIVHVVRVPGSGRVLCRAVWHAVRQTLEAQQTRPGRRADETAGRRPVQRVAVRFQQSARVLEQRRGYGHRHRGAGHFQSGECVLQ